MRWEDERYVRVYTRDTGDWLDLSFEAQALFLMLLRKVDRIGELRLGKRGVAAIPALVGHPTRESLVSAVGELMADGCVQIREDGVLFIPNFLKAQEAPKSSTERKREQRERDAAEAAAKSRMSRDDVTKRDTRDSGHSGHEMSPRAVPSLPCRAEPSGPAVTETAPPVPGVADAPKAIAEGARQDKRPTPTGEVGELRAQLDRVWFERRGVAFDWALEEERAVGAALGKANGKEEELVRRFRNAVQYVSFPVCGGIRDLVKHWNHYATAPPTQTGKGRAPESAKYRSGEQIDEAPF